MDKRRFLFLILVCSVCCFAERLPERLFEQYAAKHNVDELLKYPAQNHMTIKAIFIDHRIADHGKLEMTIRKRLEAENGPYDRSALLFLLASTRYTMAVRRIQKGQAGDRERFIIGEAADDLIESYSLLSGCNDSGVNALTGSISKQLNAILAHSGKSLRKETRQKAIAEYLNKAYKESIPRNAVLTVARICMQLDMQDGLSKRFDMLGKNAAYLDLLAYMKANALLHGNDAAIPYVEELLGRFGNRILEERAQNDIMEVLRILAASTRTDILSGFLKRSINDVGEAKWLSIPMYLIEVSKDKDIDTDNDAIREYMAPFLEYAATKEYPNYELFNAITSLMEFESWHAAIYMTETTERIARDSYNKRQLCNSLFIRGRCYESIGLAEKALSMYRQSLPLIEESFNNEKFKEECLARIAKLEGV